MKMARLIFAFLFVIIFTSISYAEIHYPELPMPKDVYAEFKNERDVESYLDKNKNSKDYFLGSIYYMYEALNISRGKELRKGIQKKYVDRAIQLNEYSVNNDKNNALYKANLGALYGIKIMYTGFPALMELAKKCQVTLNEAIQLAPNNPELRLIRLRAFVNFPYEYYGNLKKLIDEDSKIILDWTEQYFETSRDRQELAGFFQEIKNETLYLTGTYYQKQIKDQVKAKTYYSKIEKGSYYYSLIK